ncbi:Hypothetical protein PHPALM_1128, partial [Phytophthora palmivora]
VLDAYEAENYVHNLVRSSEKRDKYDRHCILQDSDDSAATEILRYSFRPGVLKIPDYLSHNLKKMWCTHCVSQALRGAGSRDTDSRFTGRVPSFTVRSANVIKDGTALWKARIDAEAEISIHNHKPFMRHNLAQNFQRWRTTSGRILILLSDPNIQATCCATYWTQLHSNEEKHFSALLLTKRGITSFLF